MNSLLSEWEDHQVFVLEEKNQKAGHLKYLSENECLPILIYLKPLFPDCLLAREMAPMTTQLNAHHFPWSHCAWVAWQGPGQSHLILDYPVPQASFRTIHLNENLQRRIPFLVLVILGSWLHTPKAFRNIGALIVGDQGVCPLRRMFYISFWVEEKPTGQQGASVWPLIL